MSELVITIISLLIGILFIPVTVKVFKLEKKEYNILLMALLLFISSKIIISNREYLFDRSASINKINDTALQSLSILGVYVVSSFIRFVYHTINIKTKSRKVVFWSASIFVLVIATFAIIANLTDYKTGIYSIVIASFAYGCVESFTGVFNVIFSERRKISWSAVPIMISIPAVASLFAKEINHLVFNFGIDANFAIAIMFTLSALLIIPFIYLVHKFEDFRFIPYKYLTSKTTFKNRLFFQYWFAFLVAFTISFFASAVSKNIFSSLNHKYGDLTDYFSISIIVTSIFSSTFITRYLLNRHSIKRSLMIGNSIISLSLLMTILSLTLSFNNVIFGICLIVFISIGLSIVITITFTKSVEAQLFSETNVTKYYLSIKAIGFLLGAGIVFFFVRNGPGDHEEVYLINIIILFVLWLFSMALIFFRYERHNPDHTKVNEMILNNK